MNRTTISLSEIRKEYLIKFIDARKWWNDAKSMADSKASNHWWDQMRKWGGLVDLTTRLQNELKGRKK